VMCALETRRLNSTSKSTMKTDGKLYQTTHLDMGVMDAEVQFISYMELSWILDPRSF